MMTRGHCFGDVFSQDELEAIARRAWRYVPFAPTGPEIEFFHQIKPDDRPRPDDQTGSDTTMLLRKDPRMPSKIERTCP